MRTTHLAASTALCLALCTAAHSTEPAAVPRTPTLPGERTATFPYAPPGEESAEAKALAALADQVERWVADGELPGAEILVVRGGEIVLHEAVGWSDPEAGIPLPRNAVHRLASMTKPLTGTAVLLLADEGALSLDDPVAAHLPAFDHEGTRQLTVRQLMQHLGGFGSRFPRDPKHHPNLRALADAIGRAGPEAPSGEFHYSDPGSTVLGAVVEAASGLPFERYLERRLLTPLGMSDTHATFAAGADWTRRVPAGYRWWPDAGIHTRYAAHGEPTWRPDFPMPAWGHYSTAMDYARLLHFWLGRVNAEGAAPAGQPALSPATARAALRPPTAVPYGMQWEVWPDDDDGAPAIFGHGGAAGTKAWVVPEEELIVVFLTQAYRHACSEQLSMVAGRLGVSDVLGDFTLYGRWRAPAAAIDLPSGATEGGDHGRYLGLYDAGGRRARVWDDGGRLALTRGLAADAGPAGSGAVPCDHESPALATVHLVAVGENRFLQGRFEGDELVEVLWPGIELSFTFGADGRVNGYEVPYAVFPERAERLRLLRPSPPWSPRPLDAAGRQRYVGLYEVPELGLSFRVREDGGQLGAEWGFLVEPLVHGGAHLFKVDGREVYYFFQVGADGKVLGATLRDDEGSVTSAERVEAR
ncbi:MAG TPA: serine hydrolase domain-containing protein [Thermoanaerobaculia bacterium]|nr:serine hydrolase domain-containing protein [Thermoanaerobaculia bacterium]